MFIYQGDYFYKYTLNTSKAKLNLIIDKDISDSYRLQEISKKNGVRLLHCMNKNSNLYKLQKNLLKRFLEDIPLSEDCYGFVKGKSYFDFLNKHTYSDRSSRNFLKIDIKDFFQSVSSEEIKQSLSQYIKTESVEVDKEILNYINRIVTINGVLPQGAVSSPTISNIVFRRIDIRFIKYCDKLNVKYSRYADDILFSSESNIVLKAFFLNTITKILRENNFEVNFLKVKKSSDEIRFNGYIIGKEVRLSRKKNALLNRVLYICENEQLKKQLLINLQKYNSGRDREFYSIESVIKFLNGYRSFLINLLRIQTNNIKRSKMKIQLKRIEKSAFELSKL